jgi:hypothetical protein
LFLVTAQPLIAQTTVFVEGGAFVGIERLSHTSTQPPNASLIDLSGTTVGGKVSVGAFLSPHWSVRMEVAASNRLKKTATLPPPIVVQPLSSSVGQPGAVIFPPIVVTRHIQNDYRAPSATVLVGYHTTRGHRVAVGFLGGLMFLEERQHSRSQTSYSGIVIPPLITETTTINYRAAAATGIDVDIAFGEHLSFVPQVRADVFLGGLSVRPAVAFRWNF